MLRRAFVLIPLVAALAADPARETADTVTELVADLTAGNARTFLDGFDRAMAGYDKLRANVNALVAQGETQSYIDIVKNEQPKPAQPRPQTAAAAATYAPVSTNAVK